MAAMEAALAVAQDTAQEQEYMLAVE